MRKTPIQLEIAHIAATVPQPRVEIPADLRDMDALDATYLRLQQDVLALGGYEALARACPPTSAKVWQSKIERNGRHKLRNDEFIKLIELFDDMVLVALLGAERGLTLFDLRAIPVSDYSRADLEWALTRYSAQATLLASDLREAQLDGTDIAAIKSDMLQLTRETVVLLHQMTRAWKDWLEENRRERAVN